MIIKPLFSFRLLAVAVAALLLQFSFARPVTAQGVGAQLTISGTGTVRIDGVSAATGATVFSGSRVTTEGASAILTTGPTRITLNPNSDATFSLAGNVVRVDLICGSGSAIPGGPGMYEFITHADTSVFNQSGTLTVESSGRTIDLIATQTQIFNGGARIFTNGPASFDVQSCLCPTRQIIAVPPPTPSAFPLALLLAIIGGGAAAATIIPIALDDDDDDLVVISPSFPL